MRNITYKYNVGDVVRFKDHFHRYASCGLKERAGTTAKIVERIDYGGATYRLEGITGVFKQGCFAGLASETSKNSLCRDEAGGADTLLGPETNCGTEGFKGV